MLGGVQLNIGGAKIGGRYVVGLSNINDIDKKKSGRTRDFSYMLVLELYNRLSIY